jgi:NAD(P)-dependent dehydrogenase (short-subunit alcohol dehydrogenase family)
VTLPVELFRAGLLEGRSIVLVGPPRAELSSALAELGAQAAVLAGDLLDEERVRRDADALVPTDALVVDGAALFAAAPPDGELAPLRAAADGAWSAVRAVANAAWIEPEAPGGRIVLVAPRPGDGPHANAARAAFENLARTTSIEWARFGIRITAITPADRTDDEQVAALAAYLVSPAGEFFSGTRLALG